VTGTSVNRKAVNTRSMPKGLALMFVYGPSVSFSFDELLWVYLPRVETVQESKLTRSAAGGMS
jgi:hypothetical protein